MILSKTRYPLFGVMLLLLEHDLVRKPVSTFRDHALWLERRGDELHGVFARPFGRARDRADLAAGGSDQRRGRHAGGAAHDLEILEDLGRGVGVIGESIDADLLEPGARL